MKYILTSHAKSRMAERRITEMVLIEALRNPTRLLYDENNRILVKKLYKKGSKRRLLLIVAENVGDTLKIITVIDTSKVKKYL